MSVSTPSRAGASLRSDTFSAWLKRLLLLWEHPGWSALIAMVIYAWIASHYASLWQVSRYGYFNYLADAWLHGQLHLRVMPGDLHDLSVYQGRVYLYWPPFPALLLLPFVAIWGINFSDVLFTIALGGFNVALVSVLLRRATEQRVIALSAEQRALLVLTFALGTVHVTLAPYGRVWYTAQLIGFACVALAYLATITLRGWRAFFFTGLALACALLTRNHLFLAGVWPACYLIYHHWNERWSRLLRYSALGLAPLIVALGLLGIYNALRFGSPFDNGLEYHLMATFFKADYDRYGAFNLHYLPTNLYHQFLAYPFPWRPTSTLGGSLFLLTPTFFAACWGLTSKPRWSVAGLAGSIALVAVPILLLMGTGWHQFGPRYTLDFTVPLLLLTALGIRHWPMWLVGLCAAIAIGQYIVGAFYLGTVI